MIDQLGEYLRDNKDPVAKEIMADWDAVGSREPWHRLPASMDQDHLPDMIAGLAETALLTFFARRSGRRWRGSRCSTGSTGSSWASPRRRFTGNTSCCDGHCGGG